MNFASLDSLKKEIDSYHDENNKRDHFYLSKIVEDLTFYGTGNEGVELFRATCSLAYQHYGIGDTWLAILLVANAVEQAENSRQWCDDEDDSEKGNWGY